jgi:thiosulfate/3-mercaptopyruvate sulfurtransferase
MLRFLGHDSAAVLNGGISAWIQAGYPLTDDVEHRAARTFHASVRSEMVASVQQVRERTESSPARLIDARAPERYRGEQEPIDPVAGHIPGAVNHFWQDNLNEQGLFRSSQELQDAFRELMDHTPPDEFVVYCGSGVTSCHHLLAMEHIGLKGARLYPGSWSQWCADRRRPIARGSQA